MPKTGKYPKKDAMRLPIVNTAHYRVTFLRQNPKFAFVAPDKLTCDPDFGCLFYSFAGVLTLLWLGLCMHILVGGVDGSEYQMAPAAAPSVRSDSQLSPFVTYSLFARSCKMVLNSSHPCVLFTICSLQDQYTTMTWRRC